MKKIEKAALVLAVKYLKELKEVQNNASCNDDYVPGTIENKKIYSDALGDEFNEEDDFKLGTEEAQIFVLDSIMTGSVIDILETMIKKSK